MFLPMADEALNLEDVFLVFPVFFNNVGICTYCRKVGVAILLAILAPTIFLILIFFACLALMDRRLLLLATKYVSGGSVSGLTSS